MKIEMKIHARDIVDSAKVTEAIEKVLNDWAKRNGRAEITQLERELAEKACIAGVALSWNNGYIAGAKEGHKSGYETGVRLSKGNPPIK